MVLPNGQLKLIDFGIARHFTPGKTRDTIALGTPGYAAPEQHGYAQADARTDLYALGVVLHQLLTGHDPTVTPFHLPALHPLTPNVPPQVVQAIEKSISLDPNQRPTSVQAFYNLLGQKAAPPRQPQSNWIWAIIPLLVLIPLIGLVFWWLRGEAEPTPALAKVTPAISIPTATPEDEEDSRNPAAVAVPTAVIEEPVLAEPTIDDTAVTPATPMIVCTPPVCGDGEVYFCPGDCPGGCGTICATVTPRPPPVVSSWELARSAGGRSLSITQIGEGPHKIVLIGTVRGGENPNSELVVNRLQTHFAANLESIPPEVALYFIPVLNPDGRAEGRRFNANNVDLNRNWDTPSWKSDTEQPGGTVRNSGGQRPFSEPETQALRDLLLNLQTEGESVSVIAYHHHAGIPGQGTIQPGYRDYYSPEEPSIGLARRLQQLAGYNYLPFWSGSYIPSGELIQWCTINNIAAVDVELPRGVQPDMVAQGQPRTIFEAALAGITGLFEFAGGSE